MYLVQEQCKHLNAVSSLFLPEECDKELHQIHEVTVLGEGNLSKKRRTRSQKELILTKQIKNFQLFCDFRDLIDKSGQTKSMCCRCKLCRLILYLWHDWLSLHETDENTNLLKPFITTTGRTVCSSGLQTWHMSGRRRAAHGSTKPSHLAVAPKHSPLHLSQVQLLQQHPVLIWVASGDEGSGVLPPNISPTKRLQPRPHTAPLWQYGRTTEAAAEPLWWLKQKSSTISFWQNQKFI